MAIALTKYTCFKTDIGLAVHNLNTATIKAALTNTAPNIADTVFSTGVYPAPAAANNYTALGHDTTNVYSAGKMTGTDITITATAGGIGPFRYIIIYNDDAASDQLIGYYDYGSAITLADTETFVIDFDAGAGILTIT